MSLFVNQTEISDINFNGTSIEKVIYNDVLVFEKGLYLYKHGDICNNISGGFKGFTGVHGSSDTSDSYLRAPGVSYEPSTMTFSMARGYSGIAHHVKIIDFTPYSRIIVELEPHPNTYFDARTIPRIEKRYDISINPRIMSSQNYKHVLDISHINKPMYLVFRLVAANSNTYLRIKSIKFIK